MGYKKYRYLSTASTATSTYTCIGPIDVSEFDKFCLVYEHNNSAGVSIVHMSVDASVDPSTVSAGTGTAPSWFAVNTATIPVPSALGNTAIVGTSAVDNAYRFLRVNMRTSSTAVGNLLAVTVAGFTRFTG